MSNQVQVAGDFFEILHSGNFKTKPGILWYILQVSNTKRLITIPYSFGEDEAKKLLETKYFFNYMKSESDKLFFVYVDGYPDEIMIAELEKL